MIRLYEVVNVHLPFVDIFQISLCLWIHMFDAYVHFFSYNLYHELHSSICQGILKYTKASTMPHDIIRELGCDLLIFVIC